MNNLIHYLTQIEDPRHKRGIRHQQLSILVIMIMAILCGYTSLRGMARFAKTHGTTLIEFLPLPRGKAPSYWAIRRLINALNFESFCDNFNQWMNQYLRTEGIAIDGKSIKSTVTSSQNSLQNFVSLVSLFGQKSGMILKVGLLENSKVGEIEIVRGLLQELQVEKVVFTLDALHCQKKTVKLITAENHGYLITVKKNQPNLYQAIDKQQQTRPLKKWSWTQQGHGHTSYCHLKVWKATSSLSNLWSGLTHFVSVQRQGIRQNKPFNKVTYYITSETCSAYLLAGLIRGHRHIENKLHWVKDVILHEDNCGIQKPQPAAILGLLRNIAFNLLKMVGFDSVTNGISAMGENVARLWKIITHSQPQMSYILDG